MHISNLFNLLDKVTPVRLRRKQRSQTNPAIAYDNGDDSVSACIQSTFMPSPALPSDPSLAYAISARSEQRIQVSTPGASNMCQQALTGIQAFTGLIPLAGGPMQAAINGLLTILQTIDRHTQNKSGILGLRKRLRRLSTYLCNAPTTDDSLEQLRRDDLISLLLDTSDQLKILDVGFLGYQSVAQAIARCSSELDHYLAEYALSAQMQTRSDVVEIREILLRHVAGSVVTDLPGTVTLGCLILVDATGHEHNIPLKFCASFQQLNKMLEVLFMDDSEEARIQAQYMKQGQYDLCVDKGTQVTELTCGVDGWPRIEAGMKIVMRVIVEKQLGWNSPIKCDVCGCANVSVQSVGIKGMRRWTIFCQGCKRRYQITTPSCSELTNNGTSILRQATNRQIIRNMHVQETFREREFEREREFFRLRQRRQEEEQEFRRRFEQERKRQQQRRSRFFQRFEQRRFQFFREREREQELVHDLSVLATYAMLTELFPCPALRNKQMPCCSEQDMSLRHFWHDLVLVLWLVSGPANNVRMNAL